MKERQKMQRYRQRLAAKVVYLKDLTKKMESQIRVYTLQRRSSRTLLAWEHIANALREESDATTTTNAALRDQCTQHATLIRSMKQWVMQVAGTSAESVPVSPTCMSRRPLQNLTLSADPYARRLGFDWITRHLYHNCDSAFQRMGFPASANETLASFSVDMTDPDCCMYTWRSQREFPASVEYVRDVFARPNLVGQMHGTFRRQSTLLQLPETLDSLVISQDDEILRDFQGMYTHSQWTPDCFVHFLAREFNQPGRCVFVAQNINDDAALVNGRLQRNRMMWYEPDIMIRRYVLG
ncbi:hypothetical protein DYB37_010764 [Aphanomyces astaci]|uniref:Uncharacterized protein n=1 Tax=Aphanomyces astaci TaxID=112090 RepID=A0A3L6UXU6_APHAT|nr:hypothetical protein DYB35_009563 [Aphanomyces astaci]RHZ11489.1 hypothetical protein DYB37_010764 [Aphanomyces astaci]RLO01411.1 hypothetical protein DYB28_015760 [Aphanomyces astaci]